MSLIIKVTLLVLLWKTSFQCELDQIKEYKWNGTKYVERCLDKPGSSFRVLKEKSSEEVKSSYKDKPSVTPSITEQTFNGTHYIVKYILKEKGEKPKKQNETISKDEIEQYISSALITTLNGGH